VQPIYRTINIIVYKEGDIKTDIKINETEKNTDGICGAVNILSGERLDNIGFGGLRLIQKPDEFCYGIDAVILSDFAVRGAGRTYGNDVTVCDLGTGTGIIPLVLSHKLPDTAQIFGVEVQEGSFERAVRNVKLNGLSARLHMVCGDVSDSMIDERLWDIMKKVKGSTRFEGFDVVTVNPPYTEGGRGIEGKSPAKVIARQETSGTLEDFIRTASALLKEKGDFYMVHRPSRLTDICCLCRKYRIEPKTLRFVSPRPNEAPNLLLIHGVLGGGKEIRMCAPLAVYDEDGEYTQEISMIYER